MSDTTPSARRSPMEHERDAGTRAEAIAVLIAKVEAGWPPDIDTPYMPPFSAVFGISWISKSAWDANNGSVDAAIEWLRAVLPEWEWGRTEGNVYVKDPAKGSRSTKWGGPNTSPARSLLLAGLRALLQQEGAKG